MSLAAQEGDVEFEARKGHEKVSGTVFKMVPDTFSSPDEPLSEAFSFLVARDMHGRGYTSHLERSID